MKELRDQIWANPTDRQLLSVYADWLAANGEPERAEYMQLMLRAKRTAAEEKRAEALRKKHRGKWLGDARPFVWTWLESTESPGFVGQVQCSMAKLVKGFDRVKQLGPRLVVSISEPKAKRDVVALAKLPLGTLYGIALYENDAQWIDDFLMSNIAPKLGGLRKLVMWAGEARATERGWAVMLEHLDAVEDLELTMGWNPQLWLEMLAEAKIAKTLRMLMVPGWIDEPLKRRLATAMPGCHILYSDHERHEYDRETGYYI